LHKFVVNGEEHLANVSDPQIPLALAPVVAGVPSLHNFFKHSHHIDLTRPLPLGQRFSSGSPSVLLGNGSHALGPADFATIYNVNGVYSSGITGTGRTIAIVARSNINIQDARDFRSTFALPANDPVILVNGPDPGVVSGDDGEATLDTEWAGAVGRAATIKLVVSQSTATSDGVDLSAQYIVNNNVADIMTESYGLCEASNSSAKVTLELNLAQQAAAQGITFLASTGDSGAEGCDNPHAQQTATGPVSVQLPAATPYTLAVGGTEFNEHGNQSLYWNTSGAALSYIPENVWNDSCAGTQCGTQTPNIFAGGGGASTNFSKPSWQQGSLAFQPTVTVTFPTFR